MKSGDDQNAFLEAMSGGIGLTALHAELDLFFVESDLPSDITRVTSNWEALCQALLIDLINKPIEAKPGSRFPKELAEEFKKYPFSQFNAYPRSFQLINRSVESDDPGDPPGIYWSIVWGEKDGHNLIMTGVLLKPASWTTS